MLVPPAREEDYLQSLGKGSLCSICEFSLYQHAFKMFLLSGNYVSNIILGTGLLYETIASLHPHRREGGVNEGRKGRREGKRVEEIRPMIASDVQL